MLGLMGEGREGEGRGDKVAVAKRVLQNEGLISHCKVSSEC